MPRNVTVTFRDGSNHVYQNVPDDATPDQVTQRIAGDFKDKEVIALDGGKKAPADYSKLDPTQAHAKLRQAQDSLAAQLKEKGANAVQIADAQRRFTANPVIQQLQRAQGQQKKYSLDALIDSKITMGLTDKVGPLVQAGLEYATGTTPDGFGDTYQRHQRETDQARAQYQTDHPVADYATLPANLAGGAGLGKAVAAGATTLGGLVRTGAAMGAVAGAGQSRGTLGQQAAQTAGSAVGGAVLAPVVAAAAPYVLDAAKLALKPGVKLVRSDMVRNGASRVGINIAPPTTTAPVTNSGQILLKTLADQGQTPMAAGKMVDAAQANGVPMALMDTGDETRGLASALARKPGPSRKLVRDVVLPRQEGQTERVQAAVGRDLGPTTGVATEVQRLEQSAKTRAGPLYDQARAHGEVTDPTIAAMAQHPDMQEAIAGGRQIHADETFLANAKGETPPAPLPENGHDVQSLDYTKKALDRKIDAAYSGDSAAKAKLPFLKDLRSTLLEKLDAEVPAYAKARAAYAGPMQNSEALQLGKSAITKSGDDIAAMTSKMGPGEMEHFKLGLRSAIVDTSATKGDYADTVKALVGTPKKREALAQVFGGEKGLSRFLDTLGSEAELAATHARVNTGSITSANLADDANLDGIGGMAVKAGGRFLKGHGPVSNAIATLGDLMKYGAGKAGERVRSELAAGLSETNPQALRNALKGASRAAAQVRARAPADNAAKRAAITGAGKFAGTLASFAAPNQ